MQEYFPAIFQVIVFYVLLSHNVGKIYWYLVRCSTRKSFFVHLPDIPLSQSVVLLKWLKKRGFKPSL